MKRRSFLKMLTTATVAAVTVPQYLVEEERKVVNTVRIYNSDFGAIKIVESRWLKQDEVAYLVHENKEWHIKAAGHKDAVAMISRNIDRAILQG